MSVSQLRRTLGDLRWTVLWYALGLAGYGVVIVAFWPTMKQNQATYQQLLSAFPEAFVKAFGIEDMGHFTGFVGTEYLNLMWPLIASVFVIMAASSFVAGEIDRGTAELWLSVPERRWRLLAAKELALLLAIVVLAAVSALAIGLGGMLAGEHLSNEGVLGTTAILAAFCIAVSGYTVLLSAAVSSRGTAAGLAAAVTVASYVAGILSGLSSNVEGLKYVSFETAFHPQRALAGSFSVADATVLIAAGLVAALAALFVFERRDANP